jgi:hypothetical protein
MRPSEKRVSFRAGLPSSGCSQMFDAPPAPSMNASARPSGDHRTHDTIYFTIYLPSGTKPVMGWPVVITGTAGTRHQIQPSMAAFFASRGIATIGIGSEGFGFGPLGSLQTTFSDGTSLTIPDAGRSYDQDGNNQIAGNEGSTAAANRLWTIGESDPQKQTAIDLLQLVRVIEVGVDVDGDGLADLDASKISYHGQSAGGRFGSMLAATPASCHTRSTTGITGRSPRIRRFPRTHIWSSSRRPRRTLCSARCRAARKPRSRTFTPRAARS